jgi:hypothetical protein
MASACQWTLYHPVDDLDLIESVDLFWLKLEKKCLHAPSTCTPWTA